MVCNVPLAGRDPLSISRGSLIDCSPLAGHPLLIGVGPLTGSGLFGCGSLTCCDPLTGRPPVPVAARQVNKTPFPPPRQTRGVFYSAFLQNSTPSVPGPQWLAIVLPASVIRISSKRPQRSTAALT